MHANVSILTGDAIPPTNPIINFPYKPDHFQNHAFNSIEAGNDVYVSVPTSGGKTTVAKYAVAYAVKKLGKRAIYTTPVKALSNEKYNEMKEDFKDICTMGIMTGDNKINPDAQCILMTAEILRNSLYNLKNPIENENRKLTQDIIDSIGIVIIDEVHFANDKDRGTVWEETMILLNDIPIVMLSATVKNPENYVDWLSKCRNKTVNLIKVAKRIIPLKHYVYVYGKMYEFLNEHGEFSEQTLVTAKKRYEKGRDVLKQDKDKNIVLPKRTSFIDNASVINDLINDMANEGLVNENLNSLPALVFSFSKKNCEKFANSLTLNLIDHTEQIEIEKIYNYHMHKFGKIYDDKIQQVTNIKNLISRGIAYHHSGLLTVLREIIEILFKKGLIKVLFATETFAVGVNTPTRTTVFMELSKYENGTGKRFITTAEYLQMCGRAGRRGLDTFGTVIIMPFFGFPDTTDLRNIALGELQEIKSHLKLDYTFFLKIIQSNRMTLHEFYQKSLQNYENTKQLEILKTDLNNINLKIDNLNKIILNSKQDVSQLENLMELETLSNTYIGSFKVTLSKDQQKKFKKLDMLVKSNPKLNELRQYVSDKNKLQKELSICNTQIKSLTSYIDFLSNNNLNLLEMWGYTQNGNATIKGIIASQINECNSIILTELIVSESNYLYTLTSEEIVGLISIFTEQIKSETIEGIQKKSIGTDNINKIVNDLDVLIEKYKENEINILGSSFVDWTLSKSYIDIALSWANGINTSTMIFILAEHGEYEGQFVKNMTRVYNIINDIGCICKMIGKIDLLPSLENATKLIIRDIVNVNSLYLS